MLGGMRVLIVEDEALVANQLADTIRGAEGEVAGLAASVAEARRALKAVAFDAAILDLNLSDGEITPVLEALQARHAPTLVYTGRELPQRLRERHPELVALRKPVLPGRIVAELLRARRRGSP